MVETIESELKKEDEVEISTAAKKAKTEDLTNVLNEFEFVKVLNENSSSKLIFIQAVKKTMEEDGKKDAVIIFEKPHFSLDEVKSFLNVNNEFETDITNDIYKKLCIYPTRPFNSQYLFLFFYSIFFIVQVQF